MRYTVRDPAGNIIASNVDAIDAALAIMADDARDAEIRDFYRVDGHVCDGIDAANERAAAIRDDIMADDDDDDDRLARAADVKPVFDAWHMCRQSAGDRWPRRTSYWSIEPDYDAAALEIARKIIDDAPGWRRPYQVEPD